VLSGKTTNSNAIFFGLTRGEHANHYITDAFFNLVFEKMQLSNKTHEVSPMGHNV
jgi:hypothetical protein